MRNLNKSGYDTLIKIFTPHQKKLFDYLTLTYQQKKIFDYLSDKEYTQNMLVKDMNLPGTTVYKAIKSLEECGLIKVTKIEGRNKFFAACPISLNDEKQEG